MYEIVFHGRAGQGAKSAAYIIAEASMHAGKYIQAFPEYGAAREGAPIRVFLRLDDKEIRLNTPILNPDFIMIFDQSLSKKDYIYEGIKEDSTIVVNAKEEPKYIYDILKNIQPNYNGKIFWLNATRLSLEEVGRNLTNSAMLGAFCIAEDFLNVDTLKSVFNEHFKQKLKEEVLHQNIIMIEKAYHEVKKLE